jgi:hypothetical protein
MQVAIYARVSIKNKGQSTDNQLSDLRRGAQMKKPSQEARLFRGQNTSHKNRPENRVSDTIERRPPNVQKRNLFEQRLRS